ncbi:hypothetical protein RCAP_rcc01225 [Rhodobacter capsulatus SB 1003]|uniref:Uncharacterized protein n=1 Tax=Rhodobacter capsulatus (strain ATCC BAA-309 / NBRC 16581 / SB1003) TaxID=272942 RepID=D5AS91_RHOCB|nr:hypothetical protein RCAP_rcc01225 [Rhodobacter capsulatus SB 1003]
MAPFLLDTSLPHRGTPVLLIPRALTRHEATRAHLSGRAIKEQGNR